MKRHVIIGGGIAALSAASAIREHSTDPLTIISAEKTAAYSPMLTPYYISGRIPYDALFLCDSSFYRQKKIQARLGSTAVKLDHSASKVYLSDGSTADYDSLLIATGSHSVGIPVAGCNLPGVHTLYTVSDARHIKESLQRANTVAILGAGLIAARLIDVLHLMRKMIIVVEMQERILPAVLDRDGSLILQERMKREGIKLYLERRVSRIEAADDDKRLYLDDGTVLEADAVIVATGVEPNVGVAAGSGIKLGQRIPVDESCRTNIPDVYAAGDVTETIDPITGNYQANPTWFNAVMQGRTAGSNMTGLNLQLPGLVRANIFSLFGLPVASIGLIPSENQRYQAVSRREQDEYRCIYTRGDQLVGAVLIGDVTEAGLIRQLIGKGTRWPRLWRQTGQTAFALQALLCSAQMA